MASHWIICQHCGERRNCSTDYTSPANALRDENNWITSHISGDCLNNSSDSSDMRTGSTGSTGSTEPIQPAQLLALGGQFGAGKDAFADRLVEHHGWHKVGLGDTIMAVLSIQNPWVLVTADEAEGLKLEALGLTPGHHRAQFLLDTLGYTRAKTITDMRSTLQNLGDAVRSVLGPDAWVTAVTRRIDDLLADGKNVVFPSTRLPHELGAMRDRGARTIWIERTNIERDSSTAEHFTEKQLFFADFQKTILNSGTLDDLHHQADEFCERYAPQTVPSS